MLSKHFAILALLAGLPALAQGPAAAVSPSTTPIRLRRHAPMKLSGVPLPGAVTSTNWSGYAATGTGFTKVLGSSNCAQGQLLQNPKHILIVLGRPRWILELHGRTDRNRLRLQWLDRQLLCLV